MSEVAVAKSKQKRRTSQPGNRPPLFGKCCVVHPALSGERYKRRLEGEVHCCFSVSLILHYTTMYVLRIYTDSCNNFYERINKRLGFWFLDS